MKVENAEVIMNSNLESEKKHSSSMVKFELHQGLSKLKENAYKAHVATGLLLNPDFSAYKSNPKKTIYGCESQMSLQERSKKAILDDLLDRFFNGDDLFLYPKKEMTEEELKDSAVVIETKEEYYQKQTIDFTTYVQIKTPNDNYTLNLEVAFSKELYEAHEIELQLGNTALLDPLVINYDDDINPFDNLSKLRFEFDLDSNGETDLIPLLKKGAGFLAYDKNENGAIDNGSELFGPQTGQGFEELAKHDSDNNNWIDENDSIFNKLKVWQINEDGDNELVSLIDLNVGAIYLGSVESGFEYQESVSEISAVQRSNGVYVKNDGSGVRMINALDLSVVQN